MISLQQFVFTTIRLHYYSSPLLFVSTKFVSNNSSPLLFVSTTIRVNFDCIIYNLVDVINNAGRNSYGGSFVSK